MLILLTENSVCGGAVRLAWFLRKKGMMSEMKNYQPVGERDL
jgi:hypothetical protein